jgi:hypothetical protein
VRDFIPDILRLFSVCILATGPAIVLSLVLMGGSGCVAEKTYKLSTSCPDVWQDKPSQSVSLIVEFKQ